MQPQLAEGYDVGQCPSCSLLIRIIFDQVGWLLFDDTTCANVAALQMDFEQYASAEEPVKEDIKAKPVDTTASVAVAAAA